MADDERFEQGLQTRREVLGSEYVDRAFESGDEFTLPWQRLLTEHAWNDLWNRPGLDRKTRSLLTIAILAVLGRSTELASHTRGALRNGATPEEIAETFIHMSGYAGFPAGVEAFRTAQPIIADFKAQAGGAKA